MNKKRLNLLKRRKKGLYICKKIWHYDDSELTAKNIGKAGITPTPCSCDSCRNKRRSNYYNSEEKLTLQERRDKDFIQNELNEYLMID